MIMLQCAMAHANITLYLIMLECPMTHANITLYMIMLQCPMAHANITLYMIMLQCAMAHANITIYIKYVKLLFTARYPHQNSVRAVPPEDGQVLPETCRGFEF
jgi:hypothetical protein